MREFNLYIASVRRISWSALQWFTLVNCLTWCGSALQWFTLLNCLTWCTMRLPQAPFCARCSVSFC